ncbi:MAG: hypothetical protein AB7I41_12240 [Candidatus Sericytochromatia bacterium]
MKLFSTLLAASVLLYTVVACTAPSTPSVPNTPSNNAPAAQPVEPSDADLKALAKTYTSFPALNTELKKSPTHEGMMVRTHLDSAAMQAFNSKSYPFPDGSVSVKEGHKSADGPTEALFVMKKIKGYDTANGDWFYAMTAPDGTAMQKGKVQM